MNRKTLLWASSVKQILDVKEVKRSVFNYLQDAPIKVGILKTKNKLG